MTTDGFVSPETIAPDDLPVVASLLPRLREAYGDVFPQVIEVILRESAIVWGSGGAGDGASMLSMFRHCLQYGLDERTWAEGMPGRDVLASYRQYDDLCPLLAEFESRFSQFDAEAMNEALKSAWDWKWGEADLALRAVCQKLRLN